SKAIRSRFTPTEIDTISDIIAKEEQARVELLKKCILLRNVPQKEYLKFNDSITYMQQCNLWSTHFSSTEQHLLELIAENSSEWFNRSNINTPDTSPHNLLFNIKHQHPQQQFHLLLDLQAVAIYSTQKI